MEFVENVHIKNVSYLRARDPSIIACSYHKVNKNKDLKSALGPTSRSTSFPFEPETEIQTESENITHFQVYLRIKNCPDFKELYEIEDNHTTLLCKVPDGAHCLRNIRDGNKIIKKFTFSKIFNSDSEQTDIFNGAVKEKVLHFINGFNCSLLTYGASGSGKTFTIVGTAQEPGIIPRALEYLFRTLPQFSEQPRIKPTAAGGVVHLTDAQYRLENTTRQSLLKGSNPNIDCVQHAKTYRAMQQRLSGEKPAEILDDISDVSLGVWVSFAEIYNEHVYDLLKSPPARGQQKQKLRLGYCNGNAYIKDLTCIGVSSGLEAYQILQYGLHNLRYAATLINDHSSRSHSIFTIKLAQASNANEDVGMSIFNFCDLAGSERLKHTHNVGDRLKESNNINTSLLVLGRCISLVRESQRNNDKKLIPFRESKLTQLFQRALLGHEAIAMIVNINPIKQMFDESQHVLNFSAVAKDVLVEEQEIIRHPHNRFSEYMDRRPTELANSTDKADREELQQLVTYLYNELAHQKQEAEDERQHVVTTYKGLLDDSVKYWEKRCQDLQDLLRKNMQESRRKSFEPQAKKPRVSIISIDSSTDEDDDATNPKSSATTNSHELVQAKCQLTAAEAEIERLKSEKTLLKDTLKDAESAYQELHLRFKTDTKELYSQTIKQQDQIIELTAYIEQLHQKHAGDCDSDDGRHINAANEVIIEEDAEECL